MFMNKKARDSKNKKPDPIKKKKEVEENPDPGIDKDFPGYPHLPAHEKNIHPETEEDEKNADLREADSDGSPNAFKETEEEPEVLRGELNKDKENY